MPRKILFCVLNWGLGHASRSTSLIQQLLNEGNKISIASDGGALQLLRKEFPKLSYFELPSYNITYKYDSIVLNLITQARKFRRAIKKERRMTSAIVKGHGFDQIISDNRFGCYHSDVESIFLTHQIRLLHDSKFIRAAGTVMNTGLIENFDACWVPDHEDGLTLSGLMSHNVELDIPTRYIGPLSRFKKHNLRTKYKFKSLTILSGPEPQRTLLEEKILSQLRSIGGMHAIVMGKASEHILEDYIQKFGLLDHKQLSRLLNESEFIISRSGYSSIMDYDALDRKAILIPTPGQTEQIYLAKRLSKSRGYISFTQENLDLQSVLD